MPEGVFTLWQTRGKNCQRKISTNNFFFAHKLAVIVFDDSVQQIIYSLKFFEKNYPRLVTLDTNINGQNSDDLKLKPSDYFFSLM